MRYSDSNTDAFIESNNIVREARNDIGVPNRFPGQIGVTLIRTLEPEPRWYISGDWFDEPRNNHLHHQSKLLRARKKAYAIQDSYLRKTLCRTESIHS